MPKRGTISQLGVPQSPHTILLPCEPSEHSRLFQFQERGHMADTQQYTQIYDERGADESALGLLLLTSLHRQSKYPEHDRKVSSVMRNFLGFSTVMRRAVMVFCSHPRQM